MLTLETYIDLVDRAHDVLSGEYRHAPKNSTKRQQEILAQELLKDLWEAKWKSGR